MRFFTLSRALNSVRFGHPVREGHPRNAVLQYIFAAIPPAQKFAAAFDISQLVPSQLINSLLKTSKPTDQGHLLSKDSPPNIAAKQVR